MGLGLMEIVIIGVAGLVLLGPARLPGILRQAAKLYVHLRRTSNDFKSAFDHVVQEAELEMLRKPIEEVSFTKSTDQPPVTATQPFLEGVTPSDIQAPYSRHPN